MGAVDDVDQATEGELDQALRDDLEDAHESVSRWTFAATVAELRDDPVDLTLCRSRLAQARGRVAELLLVLEVGR